MATNAWALSRLVVQPYIDPSAQPLIQLRTSSRICKMPTVHPLVQGVRWGLERNFTHLDVNLGIGSCVCIVCNQLYDI